MLILWGARCPTTREAALPAPTGVDTQSHPSVVRTLKAHSKQITRAGADESLSKRQLKDG